MKEFNSLFSLYEADETSKTIDAEIKDIEKNIGSLRGNDRRKEQERLDKLKKRYKEKLDLEKEKERGSEEEKRTEKEIEDIEGKKRDAGSEALDALKSGDIYDRVLGAAFAGGTASAKNAFASMSAEEKRKALERLKKRNDDVDKALKSGDIDSARDMISKLSNKTTKRKSNKPKDGGQPKEGDTEKKLTPEQKEKVLKSKELTNPNTKRKVSANTAYHDKTHPLHKKAKQLVGESFDNDLFSYIINENIEQELEKELKRAGDLSKKVKQPSNLDKELEKEAKKSEDLAKKVGAGKEVEEVDAESGEKASEDFENDEIVDNSDTMDEVPEEGHTGPKVKEGDQVEIADPENPDRTITVTVKSDPITGEIIDPRTNLPLQKDSQGKLISVDPKTGQPVANTSAFDPTTGEKKPEAPEDADPTLLPFSDKVRMVVSLFREYGFTNFDFKLDDGKNVLVVDGEVSPKVIEHAKIVCDKLKILIDSDVKRIEGKKKITSITFTNNMDREDFEKIWATILRRENERKANSLGQV